MVVTTEELRKAMGDEGWYSYQPLLDLIAQEIRGTIVLQKDFGEYQGDTFVLYKLGEDRWGVLLFGWGSCSGCDALQACDTVDQVMELYEQLNSATLIFESDREAIEWFNNRQVSGSFYFNDVDWPEISTLSKAIIHA